MLRIIVVLFFCGLLPAQIETPERKVEANVITSERDPKVQIRLPKSVRYIGADRWVLYGIADCELHAFIEADDQKNVQRLYWVQFEGYIPSKPDLKHDYDSPRHAKIGGLDFYVDTWVRQRDAETRPGSDREHIEALIRTHGYKMPAGMMYVRLVHLLDEQKRKELMIVYGEDLAPTGLTASELQEGGKAYDQWPSIEKGLVERAEAKIAIEETPNRPLSQSSEEVRTGPGSAISRPRSRGSMRVPAIIHWPGKIPGGVVTNEILAAVDWPPTLAAMAGASNLVPKDRPT